VVALALAPGSRCAWGHPLDTWHIRQPGSGTGYLQGVCFGNGRFVTVGINGTVETSDTGEQWSQQTSGTTVLLESIAYGNSRYVAVGDLGTIISSPDGTNWTTQASGLFVAAGNNLILTSPDGFSWAAQNPGLTLRAASLATGDGRFIFAGNPGTNVISMDGTNWFERPSGTDQGIYTIGFGAGVFLCIDTDLSTFISADASNWVQQAPVTVFRPAAVAFGNGCFVTGGSGGMEYGTLGSAWTLAAAACLPRDICFGDGTFVAVGFQEAIVQSDPVIWLHLTLPGTVEIYGPTGKTYSIESKNGLAEESWITRTNLVPWESPYVWGDPDIPLPSKRFYRASLQP